LEIEKQKKLSTSRTILVIIVFICLGTGGFFGYLLGFSQISQEIDNLETETILLQEQLSKVQSISSKELIELKNQILELQDELNKNIISLEEINSQQNPIETNPEDLDYYLEISGTIDELQAEIDLLKEQLIQVVSTQNQDEQPIIVVSDDETSIAQIYAKVEESVVVIRGMILAGYDIFGRSYYSQVQGSGFVYDFMGQFVVITNNHVVDTAVNITITFSNGNAYSATVLGSDPYADLAVLSADAPESEFVPIEISNSRNLLVGDSVMVVGSPYGLAGSMSVGYVSALGRTLSAENTGGYVIANVIQTTAALNPGNSGGPVLNFEGEVIGIATAIVENSEGLGFAIPSNTILREIEELINIGSYENHPWLGASGVDMSYEIAEIMNTDVTYGWLIAQIISGGPAYDAGLQSGTEQVMVVDEQVIIGGDIIISIDTTRITGIDDLSAYLEEYTLPGQTIDLTVIRDNETIVIPLELESRPTNTTTT
jgi:S1-C subfamily serine protease